MDFKQLLIKIYKYGFAKFIKQSHISASRLLLILDGEKFFTLKEIEKICRILNISVYEKDMYFFTSKVDMKQLC